VVKRKMVRFVLLAAILAAIVIPAQYIFTVERYRVIIAFDVFLDRDYGGDWISDTLTIMDFYVLIEVQLIYVVVEYEAKGPLPANH
jgi:hypothetical protein